MQQFQQATKGAGMVVKEENTIIEPWPTRLKLQAEQAGAQEEFNLVLASNFTGVERYVEWKKV